MDDIYTVHYFHSGLNGYITRNFGAGAHAYAIARAFYDSILSANYPRFDVQLCCNSFVIDSEKRMDF